jgi:hypothetical protein
MGDLQLQQRVKLNAFIDQAADSPANASSSFDKSWQDR